MERHINNYSGLNKDAGRDVIQPNFYIDANDIRISTDRGESMGSWTNIKGNTEAFTIPTESEEGDPFGTWSAVGTVAIIGYTTIRNKIVFFVADDSGSNGWIYEVEYDEATLEILPGYPSLVYYSNILMFNKEWPIEAIGHYESDCKQRVYWTDYNNFLRTINIVDPNLPNIVPGLLDIFPDIEYTQPLLKVVTGGGSMLAGTYQVAYRLVTVDGKETLVSPPSNLFHIVPASETLTQSANYFGSDLLDENTSKSIEVTIDTSNYGQYETIQLIVVRYPNGSSLNPVPEVTLAEETNINNLPEITFTYTGVEGQEFPIELLTFTTKSYPFKTAKTLTQKDASLVIANIKGSIVSVQDLLEPGETFDAKTRRYRNVGGIVSPPFTPGTLANNLKNAFNVSSVASATRGYNTDAQWDPNWHTNLQYKYKANGTTLGGDGPNISYKFHLERMTIDGNNPTAGFGNVSNIPDFPLHNLNDGYGDYTNTTFPSFASPFLSGLLRGYKRGEVYRFGIVFYTNKGEATYVEYIGDIKFPDLSDVNDEVTCTVDGVDYYYYPTALEENAGVPFQFNTIGLSLGIEFSIDLTSCASLLNKVTSYQVVRVKREESDRHRLAQGVLKTFWRAPVVNPASGVNFDLRIPEGVTNGRALHLFPYAGSSGNLNAAFTTLTDHDVDATPPSPSVTQIQVSPLGDYYLKGDYIGFYSPELSYGTQNTQVLVPSIATNSSLLIVGAYGYNGRTQLGGGNIDLNGIDLADNCQEWGTTVRNTFPVVSSSPVHQIKKFKNAVFMAMPYTSDYKEKVTSNYDSYYMRNYYVIDDFLNAAAHLNNPQGSASTTTPEIYKSGSGVIGNMTYINIDPLTGLAITGLPSQMYNYFRSPNVLNGGLSGGTDVANPLTFAPNLGIHSQCTPIIDIVIPRAEVYDGYSQNALEINKFMIASPVIEINALTPPSPIVYGGDTFIGMFTFQAGLAELEKDFYFKGSDGNDLYRKTNSVTELYPIECHFNLDLATGATLKTQAKFTWNTGEYALLKQENGNSYTIAPSLRMYDYMTIASQENREIVYVVKPEEQGDCIINDVRAYLSNVKINNELIDSWTQFGINNYYDIDDYGPINKIVNWKDLIHFIQDKAVGVYAINRAAITTTADGVPTELGTGQGFGKHQYYSKEHGAIHQWGVKTTDNGIYFFDAIHRKIFLRGKIEDGNVPISELKGIHSWLKFLPDAIFWRKENGGDNPILSRGITIGRDKVNDEIIFTFRGTGTYLLPLVRTTYYPGDIIFVESTDTYYLVETEFTTGSDPLTILFTIIGNSREVNPEEDRFFNASIVYDDLLQQFSSHYSATPTIYLENGDILMSPDPENQDVVYTHNIGNWGEFYGEVQEAYITMVVNPNADFNKVLRTLEYNSVVRNDAKVIDRTQTITAFRVQTEYQDTGKILYSSNRLKRKFDKWRVKIPRNQISTSQKDRLRSTYFIVTLYFDNSYNKEIICNKLMSYYDVQIF
jgi:hypothetical protein